MPLDEEEFKEISERMEALEDAVVELIAEKERLEALLDAHHPEVGIGGTGCVVCRRLGGADVPGSGGADG